MPTPIDKTTTGARGALHQALATGGRVLADLHQRYDARLEPERIAKEVLGRWPNPPPDLARLTNEQLGQRARDLARDLPILLALAEARLQTPGGARIGQSWAGGLGAGVVDGLFGSQLPSLLAGFGFFLAWLYTDGKLGTACLEVSRGLGAATLYSATKTITEAFVRPKPPVGDAGRIAKGAP